MRRGVAEKLVAILSWAMTIILCLAVAVFLGYLLFKGVPALGIELIFGHTPPADALSGRARVFDGIFPAIIGTLYLIGLSVAIAAPLEICAGVYLAEYASPRMKNRLGLLFDILAGIPSIVIGLFGFSLAILLHQHFLHNFGPCLLISAISLAILVLPYIIRSAQLALAELPVGLRRTALALGANKLQNIVYVLVPNALSGISSGLILAIGRCAEDTAVILLTGAVAMAGVPSSLLSQYEALPFYIYYISNQYANPAELANGYGACLVLLAVCAVLFTLAYAMKQQLSYRALYRA